jgi:hypothetical protein
MRTELLMLVPATLLVMMFAACTRPADDGTRAETVDATTMPEIGADAAESDEDNADAQVANNGSVYLVYAGKFADELSAKGEQEALTAAGYDAQMRPDGSGYVVHLSGAVGLTECRRIQAELAELGYDGVFYTRLVVKSGDDAMDSSPAEYPFADAEGFTYYVYAGSFLVEDDATALLEELSGQGIEAAMIQSGDYYLVRTAETNSYTEAAEARHGLEELGIAGTFITRIPEGSPLEK